MFVIYSLFYRALLQKRPIILAHDVITHNLTTRSTQHASVACAMCCELYVGCDACCVLHVVRLWVMTSVTWAHVYAVL